MSYILINNDIDINVLRITYSLDCCSLLVLYMMLEQALAHSFNIHLGGAMLQIASSFTLGELHMNINCQK